MNNKRVVSLSPSCTEIICALGCARQMVGRSHWCDFPLGIRPVPACSAPAIDGELSSAELDKERESGQSQGLPLVQIDGQKIAALKPELIFHDMPASSRALSDLQRTINESSGDSPRFISIGSERMMDLWANIQTIADALDVSDTSREITSKLKNRVVDIIAKTCMLERKTSVACVGWIDPLTTAGLWIPELVEFAGGKDVFGTPGKAGLKIDWATLAKKDPEVIVFMLCGFDLARSRREMGALDSIPEWRKLRAVRNNKVFVTDGSQFFNRPGPRLVESLEFLAEIVLPKDFTYRGEGKTWQKW